MKALEEKDLRTNLSKILLLAQADTLNIAYLWWKSDFDRANTQESNPQKVFLYYTSKL